jgi:pimeloyl-ACP methyl ester carboxylesterase
MVTGSAQRWFAPGFIEKHSERTTRLLHTLQNADRFAYAHACEALAGFDVRERLGDITTPVIAIAGALDQVCPPEFAEAVAAGVQKGSSAVVDGVAHQAPAEAPAETAALLRDFFLAA